MLQPDTTASGKSTRPATSNGGRDVASTPYRLPPPRGPFAAPRMDPNHPAKVHPAISAPQKFNSVSTIIAVSSPQITSAPVSLRHRQPSATLRLCRAPILARISLLNCKRSCQKHRPSNAVSLADVSSPDFSSHTTTVSPSSGVLHSLRLSSAISSL